MPSHAPLSIARWLGVVAVLALAACASKPPEPARSPRPAPTPSTAPTAVPPAPTAPVASPGERDGPEARPPPDLERVPDAEPTLEVIRNSGPNKPYEVAGQAYVPLVKDKPFTERGLASWYGRKFHGRRTASGEVYNMYAMTAAHKTLPIPSYARVRNPANGREVVLRINDRGPFHPGRIIDLSYTAALKLGILNGVAPVELERITHEEIRSGAWRRGAQDTRLAVGEAAPAVAAVADASAPEVAAAPRPALQRPLVDGPVAGPLAGPSTASEPVAAVVPEPPRRAFTAAARGFWVQLGAFRDGSGAETFQRRVAAELDWLAPLLAVFTETQLHRLQAGPYPTREEAGSAAQRIREALQLVPLIVERR